MSRFALCSVLITLLQPLQARAQRDEQHDFDLLLPMLEKYDVVLVDHPEARISRIAG